MYLFVTLSHRNISLNHVINNLKNNNLYMFKTKSQNKKRQW